MTSVPASSGGSYGTFEIGISQGGTAGVSVNQTTGLIIDTHGNLRVFQTHSLGGGVGANGTAVGVFLGASNAPDLENYKQFSVDGSVSGGLLANGSVDVSVWHNGGGATGDAPFFEGGITPGAGGGLSGQITGSYTSVTPIGNVRDIPWTVFWLPPIF